MRTEGTRNRLWPLTRIVICAILLGYLLWRMDLRTLLSVLAEATTRWKWLCMGLATTFVGLVAGVVRWQVVLHAQGLPLPFRRVFSVFFIGQFFNAFMLGACGGDVVRAYYASRGAPGKRAEAASTVFVDRGLGLLVTIVFCCGVVALRPRLFLGHRGAFIAALLIVLLLAGSLVGLVALFRRNLFEHWAFFRRIEQTARLGSLIRRTYDAFYLYRHRHAVLAVTTVLSALNLAFLTLACYSFGRSLAIGRPLADYVTLFPVITVLAAVPITPGSLGVREGLFVTLFGALGVDGHYSMSLSLLVYAGSVAWSLFGGVLFLTGESPADALRADVPPAPAA